MECKMKRCQFCHKERKDYMFYFLKGKTVCWKCRPYFLKGRTLDRKTRIWVRKEETEKDIKRRMSWRKYYEANKEFISAKRSVVYQQKKLEKKSLTITQH